ncbi:CPBP family intramembrane glutamic endopeptidase [Brevundimonas sp.]|uniref:CPBP family intramembrane glutamic endopeptidase, BDIM_20840 family n=1 Tax=Brevundimonas sp. TaxID=1871086 RepID=UPI0025C198C7|nr:CPBP family intramembrane glutamic endopeptidase [Brevundimonas sp.]
MPDAIIATLAWVGAVGAAGLAGLVLTKGRIGWGWFIAALVLMIVYDALLTRGYGHIPLSFWPSKWNWEGKAMAVVLSLVVASLPVLGWRRSGLTLKQDGKGLPGALILSGFLAALFLGLALYFPGEGFDIDSLAFQMTMPGLDEELFYRGVLLLMLNEAFGKPVRVLGAQMGWGAVVSSVAFGLMHALGYSDGSFSFEPVLMATTGVSALLLVWLKEKTGSVLLPIVMHNFGNVIFMLV